MKVIFSKCPRCLLCIIAACVSMTLLPGYVHADSEIPGSMEFSYAGAPYASTGYSEDYYTGGAILMTEALTYRFDKCKISDITIANGVFLNQENAPIEIFCTYGLDQEPFLSFTGEMDIDRPKEFKTYALPEPLTITGGKPFYIGFVVWTAGCCPPNYENSYPVWSDGVAHSDLKGGYIGFSEMTGQPDKMRWTDEGYSRGQVCMSLTITGDNLPVNVAELNSVFLPDYIQPGTSEYATLMIYNRGINPITELDVSYEVNGITKSTHLTSSIPVEYNEYRDYGIAVSLSDEGANIPVTFSIDKVNGVDASATAVITKTQVVHSISRDKGFAHNMVVEEAGGRGCGWCVRGIVGLDRTYKAHNDGTFIPISAHHPGYGEETSPVGYNAIWDRYLTHNPSCLINRNISRFGIADPNFELLEDSYNQVVSIPAIASIEVTGCEVLGEELKVESEICFALPEHEAEYAVAYVVTEDNVGPYMQYNEYSGSATDMDGWENLPSPTETYFDFLARGISEFDGTSDGIPAIIVPGTKYRHSDKVSLKKVRDSKKLHVVAILINSRTGCIENGTRITVSSDAGVQHIETDGYDSEVEYYDLSGRRIYGELEQGIYIRRKGSKTNKIVVGDWSL